MYIVDQEQIDNMYAQLNQLEVYSFEGESIIDPALDIGDILIIDDKRVIYQGSSQYSRKFKASISSKIQSKSQEETTTRIPSQIVVNRRVQSQINQAEGKITQLTEETTEYEEKLTKVEQDVDSIKQSTSNSVNYKRIAEGLTEIHLYEAGEAEILKLEVKGNKEYVSELFPRNNLYPKANLQPNQDSVK